MSRSFIEYSPSDQLNFSVPLVFSFAYARALDDTERGGRWGWVGYTCSGVLNAGQGVFDECCFLASFVGGND